MFGFAFDVAAFVAAIAVAAVVVADAVVVVDAVVVEVLRSREASYFSLNVIEKDHHVLKRGK